MKPSDLGFGPKFPEYRTGQFEAALDAAVSEKRFNLLSVPTGGGKSLMYVTIAKLNDARTLVLTSTKGLQHQLTADFAESGMVDVRGQNNYRCVALDRGGEFEGMGQMGAGCDEGPCHVGVKCALREGGCLYYDAVRRAAKAPLVVTNYSYWMTANKFSDPEALGQFDMLVLDEAHDSPFELADFCAIELHAIETRQLLDMSLPPIDEGQEVWSEWAVEAYRKCRQLYAGAKFEFESMVGNRRAALNQMKRLTGLGRKLKELALTHEWKRTNPSSPNVWLPGAQTDWVAEHTDKGAKFSPVWAHAYSELYLFKEIPRIVLTSATLQPITAKYLGIPESSMVFREYASSFNPKKRPLIYIPTTNVDRGMNEGQIRIWINKIDNIIDGRMDRKGIIHTRSYDRARIILERSRHRSHMLSHTSRTARGVVEKFKRSTAPTVLVSPSMETGYDFPYDECRYQIIAKVPFVDSRSPIVQARAKSDKAYLNYLTSIALIQQVGRGMRAEDDWCETFIVDDHISWFWQAAKRARMFPKWFQAAFRRELRVPEPLSLAIKRR